MLEILRRILVQGVFYSNLKKINKKNDVDQLEVNAVRT